MSSSAHKKTYRIGLSTSFCKMRQHHRQKLRILGGFSNKSGRRFSTSEIKKTEFDTLFLGLLRNTRLKAHFMCFKGVFAALRFAD